MASERREVHRSQRQHRSHSLRPKSRGSDEYPTSYSGHRTAYQRFLWLHFYSIQFSMFLQQGTICITCMTVHAPQRLHWPFPMMFCISIFQKRFLEKVYSLLEFKRRHAALLNEAVFLLMQRDCLSPTRVSTQSFHRFHGCSPIAPLSSEQIIILHCT